MDWISIPFQEWVHGAVVGMQIGLLCVCAMSLVEIADSLRKLQAKAQPTTTHGVERSLERIRAEIEQTREAWSM
jgi:hypothetical protein